MIMIMTVKKVLATKYRSIEKLCLRFDFKGEPRAHKDAGTNPSRMSFSGPIPEK